MYLQHVIKAAPFALLVIKTNGRKESGQVRRANPSTVVVFLAYVLIFDQAEAQTDNSK